MKFEMSKVDMYKITKKKKNKEEIGYIFNNTYKLFT